MSWSIGNAILQPGDNQAHNTDGNTKTFAFKDILTDLQTKVASLVEGDQIQVGWKAKTWSLRSIPGGWGELTINCVPPDPTTTSEGVTTTHPLEDIWSIKSCRNDVSLFAYCGPSPGANPLRYQIENWLKETETNLASGYQYRDGDGSVVSLSSATQTLAAKFAKGVQSVMRFYPVVMRRRTYSDVPPSCLENLGYIDDPPYSASGSASTKVKKPNGLSTAIASHQWLKVQDDADQQQDGKWSRTEAWMGIPRPSNQNADLPWDADLYGENRWPMPYYAS